METKVLMYLDSVCPSRRLVVCLGTAARTCRPGSNNRLGHGTMGTQWQIIGFKLKRPCRHRRWEDVLQRPSPAPSMPNLVYPHLKALSIPNNQRFSFGRVPISNSYRSVILAIFRFRRRVIITTKKARRKRVRNNREGGIGTLEV